MSLNRREFLAAVGGASLVYAFRFPGRKGGSTVIPGVETMDIEAICAADDKGLDYSEWIIFGKKDTVTAFTGRTELGQGLRTVVTALVSQGLYMSPDKLKVVMGDTDLCPDDGPTSGSSATPLVGWYFWLACRKIVNDIKVKGAKALGLTVDDVDYRNGSVESRVDKSRKVDIDELRSGKAVLMSIEPKAEEEGEEYKDIGLNNVLSEAIVTGQLQFGADIYPEGVVYGAIKASDYHYYLTSLESVDISNALQMEGIIDAGQIDKKTVVVIGESYSAVRNALKAVKTKWSRPKRKKKFLPEKEIRENSQLRTVMEQAGDVEAGLAQSDVVLSETYTTQPLNSCPIETDSAVSQYENGYATVWIGTQYPFGQREEIAAELRVQKSNVHVIGMQVGGGYGGKISFPVGIEASIMSRFCGLPVKYIYSREDQFAKRGRAKEMCVIDLTTGVDSRNRIIARKIDIHQDEGNGTNDLYDIANVLTRLYGSELPYKHATIRGTSYIQDVFALESHMDQVAHAINMDPMEFRMRNVSLNAFQELIPAAAEMIGYGSYEPPEDHAIGLAIVNHGARELGAFFVEAGLDRNTGHVKVKKVCAALDIGTVINHRTAVANIRGAIMWGIGFALKEEMKLDGYRMLTRNMADYKITRFSDTPKIEIRFLRAYPVNGPRGCGEMPVVAVAPAIANAFFNITGVRLYSTPFTPERVLKALS